MKNLNRSRRMLNFKALSVLIVFLAISAIAQDLIFYEPSDWVPLEDHPACGRSQPRPDSVIYNRTFIYGDIPIYGYPYHRSLFVGANDTLHAIITFYNHTGKDYSFAGKNVEEWFAPQVYEMWVTDSGGPRLRDANELGYRMRGWSKGRTIIPDQDVLRDFQTASIKLDFWNLPEGHNQLCLLPTGKAPKDFTLLTGGHVYTYYPPHSMADSINAYEACYYRAKQDSNFSAAEMWTDIILNTNPYSVPGWWLKADFLYTLGDSTGGRNALESAFDNLMKGNDPCMPNASQFPLRDVEQAYVDFMEVKIKYALE